MGCFLIGCKLNIHKIFGQVEVATLCTARLKNINNYENNTKKYQPCGQNIKKISARLKNIKKCPKINKMSKTISTVEKYKKILKSSTTTNISPVEKCQKISFRF